MTDDGGEAATFAEGTLTALREQLTTGQRGQLGITLEGGECGLHGLGKLCLGLNRLLNAIAKERGEPAIYWQIEGAAFIRRADGVLMHLEIGTGVKPKRRRRTQ